MSTDNDTTLPEIIDNDTTLPEIIDADTVETWCRHEGNLDRTRELGKRLFYNRDPEKLRALDSLGEDEDRITTWAIENQQAATLLMMKLASILL